MRENKQLRFQNTWDSSSIVETSSINHARSASPASRGLQGGERTQRVRPYPNKKRSKATKMLFLKRHADIGFGFSIRGGIEHGTGIFVSNINKYSDAFSQGLQIGDQVLKGNKQSFEEVTHEEAVQFIQSQRTLRLMVLSLGIIPGSKIEHTRYQWIDCYGRPCSPLPFKTFPTTDPDNAEESGSMRPLEDDERKVNIVVGNNSRLGLLIRGGMEYGLGIFIAGIDEDSVADRSAVMVGEQIIEVNGISFLNIGHADAAHIIRTSKMMTMILKDVGKIPLARVVYDQTEWLDRRSIRSRSPQDISPRDRDSMIQSGIAGSQLHHQSVTGPTSYQWIEEKAQYCLSEDEWNTLKYYVREYVHGRLSVNEFVFTLLELLDSNEKKSLIQEVRGIVRAQDIERFDEMMLRIEVQAIKIQNEQDSEEDNIIVLQEESIAASPYDPVYHSSSPAGRNGFDYDQLQEDSYHSTMENITQESILQQSPQKFVPRNIMDEEIIEEEEIEEILEEPVYATVNTHKTHDAETATILKDYDNLESVKKFTTFSPPTQIKNKETVPHISERVTEEEKDFEQNKLGYAFSFLNSTNEELESPRNEILGSTSDKKEPSDDDDDQSVVSVSSLENGEEPTPPSSISRGQHFPGFNVGSANRRQKSNVIDLDFSPSEETAPSIQDFQPKFLSNQLPTNTSVPSIAIANATPEVKRKNVSDNAYVKINKGTEPASSPSFDSAPSLEHRYSNFSVNDIMRQSFLPTTRLEYDPLNSSNEDIDFLNRSVEDTSRREKRLNQVSSLNIQNQYEYEKTEKLKNLSFSSMESLTKLEEPKNYGKPVMTKSPRNDFYVSSNSNTLSKKVKEEVPTIKSVNSRENNVAVEDKHFNIARFHNDTRNDDKILSQTIEQHLEYRNPYDREHSTIYKRKSPVPVPKKEEKALSVDIDFRAADSPPSPYQYEPPRNTKNNAIRSRIDAFNVYETDGNSLKKSDGKKQNSKTNSLTKPTKRTVSIQRRNDDPGFTVDSRQKQEETEMFIDEIQDTSITDLTVGDVIIGIDNTHFKKGLQKGLANLIIRNAFSNSESSEIKVHLKL